MTDYAILKKNSALKYMKGKITLEKHQANVALYERKEQEQKEKEGDSTVLGTQDGMTFSEWTAKTVGDAMGIKDYTPEQMIEDGEKYRQEQGLWRILGAVLGVGILFKIIKIIL